MGIIVVNGDLRKVLWTIEGEWVLTWLTGLDRDLRKVTCTIESE